jgi:RNA polymerase sigma-70 factor, ECF subfamily
MAARRAHEDEVTGWALAARNGDLAARERFVRGTQRDVWRFVAYLAGPCAADDLAQETYLRALRSLPRFAGRSSARNWLLSIARRVVVDEFRAARVRPRRAETEDWQGAVEQAQPTGAPGFDEGVALAGLLAALPAERREAFVLTQTLGLSYAEAAGICRCPVGTIRSRVARARDELIALWQRAESTAPDRSTG